MDRRSFLSSVSSVSLLSIYPSIGKTDEEFYETRKLTDCVFYDDEYSNEIRFYELDPPFWINTCDVDDKERCIFICVHKDYTVSSLGFRTKYRFGDQDIYLNLRRKEDDFLVAQRGLAPAHVGKEYLGWD